jgi:TctA family transporter
MDMNNGLCWRLAVAGAMQVRIERLRDEKIGADDLVSPPDEDSLPAPNLERGPGPEAANNAGAQTCFIPMLTLGIPPNVVMALMIGAMMLHNIQPGPQVMTRNPELFWGLIASMWLGNLMLVVLNLPLVGIWARLLSVPYRFLYPAIILFCCIGVYTLSNNILDVRMVVLFGAVGYLLAKIGCEPAPMLLGFILGPMMEEFFRRALIVERGDFSVFVTRPISAALLAAALALLVSMSLPAIAKWRGKVVAEQHG